MAFVGFASIGLSGTPGVSLRSSRGLAVLTARVYGQQENHQTASTIPID